MAEFEIDMSEEMAAFVEAQVAAGGYYDVSDYVVELVRDREEAIGRLRQLLRRGDASPDSQMTVAEIVDRAKDRYQSRAA